MGEFLGHKNVFINLCYLLHVFIFYLFLVCIYVFSLLYEANGGGWSYPLPNALNMAVDPVVMKILLFISLPPGNLKLLLLLLLLLFFSILFYFVSHVVSKKKKIKRN